MNEKLTVLLQFLPFLREQGVSSLKIDGVELLLGPLPVKDEPKPEEEPPGRDPVTYGLRPGSKMPASLMSRARHG